MRIEVLKAFAWTWNNQTVCFHPPGVPYHPAEKREPERYLNAPEDLPVEGAQWAIKRGAAREVPERTGQMPPAPKPTGKGKLATETDKKDGEN